MICCPIKGKTPFAQHNSPGLTQMKALRKSCSSSWLSNSVSVTQSKWVTMIIGHSWSQAFYPPPNPCAGSWPYRPPRYLSNLSSSPDASSCGLPCLMTSRWPPITVPIVSKWTGNPNSTSPFNFPCYSTLTTGCHETVQPHLQKQQPVTNMPSPSWICSQAIVGLYLFATRLLKMSAAVSSHIVTPMRVAQWKWQQTMELSSRTNFSIKLNRHWQLNNYKCTKWLTTKSINSAHADVLCKLIWRLTRMLCFTFKIIWFAFLPRNAPGWAACLPTASPTYRLTHNWAFRSASQPTTTTSGCARWILARGEGRTIQPSVEKSVGRRFESILFLQHSHRYFAQGFYEKMDDWVLHVGSILQQIHVAQQHWTHQGNLHCNKIWTVANTAPSLSGIIPVVILSDFELLSDGRSCDLAAILDFFQKCHFWPLWRVVAPEKQLFNIACNLMCPWNTHSCPCNASIGKYFVAGNIQFGIVWTKVSTKSCCSSAGIISKMFWKIYELQFKPKPNVSAPKSGRKGNLWKFSSLQAGELLDSIHWQGKRSRNEAPPPNTHTEKAGKTLWTVAREVLHWASGPQISVYVSLTVNDSYRATPEHTVVWFPLGTHSQRRSNQRAAPSCCPVVLWRHPIGFVWRLLLNCPNHSRSS